MIMVSACAVSQNDAALRVALLAPFEGRYREVGYNALFSARLALSDHNNNGQPIELIAVDDGGSAALAAQHATAIAEDKQVRAIILIGRDATSPTVFASLGNIPAIVVGYWGDMTLNDSVFYLTSSAILPLLNRSPEDNDLIGGDLWALEQFARSTDDINGMTLITSGGFPDAAFADRYSGSDPFAPQPGLLATLSYDAFGMAVEILQQNPDLSRPELSQKIAITIYQGVNGEIRFEAGFWMGAPLNFFQYDSNGRLLPIERIIE